ncbi:hypothetical protein [Xanthomonas arboricola]|uniref:AbiU2 domain-containing protein n=1 Tax=Xanthomonas arboricola TaxID=56448 RepID=UPI00161F150B|nr:hypothetical protein [Xanthomonas arboricola]MBB3759557.1 hypothetical protein [Xanthomonas arboricola]
MRKSKGTPLTALEIRQALWMRINRALVCHDLFKDIDRLANDNVAKFNQHLRFFQTCESALHDATIVAIYSLYETPQDRVSFLQLINAIPADKMTPALRQGFVLRIDEIKPSWLKVAMVRNEVVGHQTIARSYGEVRERANLTFACVEEVLAHSRDLLFDIANQCMNTHVDFMTDSHGAADRLFAQLTDPMILIPPRP